MAVTELTKTCTRCRRQLPATRENFSPNKNGRLGLAARCMPCQREILRAYDQTAAGQKALKARQARRRKEIREYGKAWSTKNLDRRAAQARKRREAPEFLENQRKYQAEWARLHRRDPEWKEWNKSYKQRPDVRQRERKRSAEYKKRRLRADGEYAFRRKTATDVCRSMRDLPLKRRPQKWWYEEFLDYGPAELRKHLQAQFTSEMNWENYGKVWEIDHIKPLSAFVIPSPECAAFRQAWALSNLRPLQRHLNNAKGAKLLAA